MTSRNLTEVFVIMRNNAIKNRHLYNDDRGSADSEKLLKRSIHDAEEGLELQDDCVSPPVWLDKLEEAQYTMSKIKPKLDVLGSLHVRHLLRPNTFDETNEEEDIDDLSQEISKLIASTHRHIQCIRSSLGCGNKTEQQLTQNVVTYLLLSLQDLTIKYRNGQNQYLNQLNSREERSKKFFEPTDFTTIDLNETDEKQNNVETFDNFLQPKSNNAENYYDEENLDDQFQKPVSAKMTQQQLLLFEEENTKLAEHREMEVNKIVKSIVDLNDIFKDLSHMVQEQGTVLDRIDYNVEQTQVRVFAGLKQLQKAEMYQRKNRKIMAIMILSGITLFMTVLLVFTKL
ncbi:syntaxin-16 [Condylostylus longicornis]|uniref:syntaxin-16 n=1 Tax=Condylostylus longicornis TaxID=2530218 RepID=UPI00244E2DED|nr:syntaxin-16 [Condylostylus longicornis]